MEVGGKGLGGHLDQEPVSGEFQGQGVIVGAVGAHGDAEAGVVAAVAVHEGELHQLPDPGVVQVVIAAVSGVDPGLNPLGVDVAGAGSSKIGLVLALLARYSSSVK